ncbi:MAG TPA: hypothetical protein PLD88_05150, partial [Candidatus Berkiella sp.]|nr:hypothetical protein [Candidatus Berkiella sp.]
QLTVRNGQYGRWAEYSTASDVYALGVMLKADLQLSPKIYERMLQQNPGDRTSLSEVMQALTAQLAKQKGLDAEAQKVLAEFTSVGEEKTRQMQTDSTLSERGKNLQSEIRPTIEDKPKERQMNKKALK